MAARLDLGTRSIDMAGRVAAFDWASTSLGPLEGWPGELRGVVDLVLASPLLASVVCGPERLLIYNDAAAAQYGDRHPEALGRPLEETWPEAYAQAKHHYDRVFAGESVHVPAEPLELAREGSGQVFDVYLTPVRDVAGHVVAAHSAGFEVGSRLRDEATVRESEVLFRTLADVVPQLVWSGEGPGADYYNRRWYDFTGLTEAESLELNAWQHVVHPDDLAEAAARSERSDRTGEPYEVEYRLRRADGAWCWHIARAERVADGARWVGAATDIEELKQAQEAARASAKRQAFLLRLSDALRAEPDEDAAANLAVRLLAEELEADLCYLASMSPDEDRADITHRFRRGDGPTIASAIRISDFPEAFRLNSERTLVINDSAREPGLSATDRRSLAAMGFGAVLAGTLRQGEGRPIWTAVAVTAKPRRWAAQEVALVEEVAERTWAAVERARAEARLRNSEQRLRRFGKASTDVLWIRDARTLQWEYLTNAFEDIYGLSCGEALRGDSFRNWLDLIVPEDRAHARDMIDRVRGGESVTFEYRVRRPVDGAVRWLRNSDFPIAQDGDRVAKIGGIGRDITAERQIADALRGSEHRLQVLMTGIPQLVWRSCDMGLWTWAGPQWTSFTGQPEAESRGRGWLDVVHPDDHEAAMRAWEAARPHGLLDVEYRVRRARDGAWIWHNTRSMPVRDADGRIVEWLGTSTDIDDLRRLQESQSVLVEELQHRTRNLIAVVQSIADRTLRRADDLPAFAESFGERMAALARVQGLLSRLHEGERVTFDGLLRSELDALGAEAGKVELDGPAGVRLRSSTVQMIAMALHELATNAVKYGALGQDGARLRVAWRVGPDPLARRRLLVDWEESGVAMPLDGGGPRRGGQGRELIERALPYQLGARTALEVGPDGLRCRLELPISER